MAPCSYETKQRSERFEAFISLSFIYKTHIRI